MGFPVDIKLPDQARYYTFIETSKRFNSNYDITWSFEYKLPETSIPNNNNYELGFSTFITNYHSTHYISIFRIIITSNIIIIK